MAKKNLLVFWTFWELWGSKKGKISEHGSEISRCIQRTEVGHQEVNELHLGAHEVFAFAGRVV
jgi:hypothetical protein